MVKVLVVDDSEEDLFLMKDYLGEEGYEVVLAESGSEAFDLFNKEEFELVLMDIQMPILSGYDSVLLMGDKRDLKTKLVFVSIVPKQEVNLSSVDGFIQKPFSKEGFLKSIKDIISN